MSWKYTWFYILYKQFIALKIPSNLLTLTITIKSSVNPMIKKICPDAFHSDAMRYVCKLEMAWYHIFFSDINNDPETLSISLYWEPSATVFFTNCWAVKKKKN